MAHQNWEISHLREGEAVSPEGLAGIMIALQDRGCANINLVTPAPYLPHVLAALEAQYRPAYRAADYPPLDRGATRAEYREAVEAARRAGLWRFAT